MTDSRRALLVFTRSPEAEARAKGLAPESASRLFSAFLASWREAAEEAGATLLISAPTGCAARFREALPDLDVLPQPARPFGARLAAAVGEVFARGFEAVSVVAGDTPAISAGELDLAFRALERGSVVVGPSRDGGVYLVGLPDAAAGTLVAGFAPRNPRLCRELESALAREGRRVARLGVRGEIDGAGDLSRACRESRWSPVWREYEFLLAAALRFGRRPASEEPAPPPILRAVSVPARAPPAA